MAQKTKNDYIAEVKSLKKINDGLMEDVASVVKIKDENVKLKSALSQSDSQLHSLSKTNNGLNNELSKQKKVYNSLMSELGNKNISVLKTKEEILTLLDKKTEFEKVINDINELVKYKRNILSELKK